jgi:hypothetical protein
LSISRAAAPDAVARALADDDALKKWTATTCAKGLALAKSDLTDFQRFKYAKRVAKPQALVKAKLQKGSGGKGSGRKKK